MNETPIKRSILQGDSQSDSFHSRFLDRYETNRNNLSVYIDFLLEEAFGRSRGSPIIGGQSGDYSHLCDFEYLRNSSRACEDVLRAVAQCFHGTPKWHHPNVMHNVNPPPMIDGVAAGAVAKLFNHNALWDLISGGVFDIEQQIVRQMARLANWPVTVDGVFTFGGKACLTYAVRIGLNRCTANISSRGIQNTHPVVITSESSHYTVDSVCALLGIGTKNCLRTQLNEDETMDLQSFENLLESALEGGKRIAAIVVSGGNTLHLSIDDLPKVNAILDKFCRSYKLDYRPFVYFDTVVGWPWLFFVDYDFCTNPLNIAPKVLEKIRLASDRLRPIKQADGFGIDFHKFGMCSYQTSLFMCKDARELHSIHRDTLELTPQKPFGENFLQHHMIEHSRSCAPIVEAWVALQRAGIDGFRTYISNGVSMADVIQEILCEHNFELLNPFSLAPASVFAVLPSDNPGSYWDLLDASRDQVQAHNIYTYQLFQYLMDEKRNGLGTFVLRFLPQYRRASCGEKLAVLVVYPMAVDIDVQDARVAAEKIAKIKVQFDQGGFRSDFDSSSIPNHVPK